MTEQGLGALIAVVVMLSIMVVAGAWAAFRIAAAISRVNAGTLERRDGKLHVTCSIIANQQISHVAGELELAQAQDSATRARGKLLPAVSNGASRSENAPS